MFRRATTVALSAALAIGLVACGSDGNNKADPTTTAAKGTTTTATTLEATTSTTTAAMTTTIPQLDDTTTTSSADTTTTTEPAPVDNETFAQLIDEAQSSLDAAISACDLRVIMDSIEDIPDPSTTGQAKLAVEFLVPLYNAVADAVAPTQVKNAAAIRALGKKFQEVAENSNYDPAALKNEEAFSAIPGIIEAFTAFIESTANCPGLTP